MEQVACGELDVLQDQGPKGSPARSDAMTYIQWEGSYQEEAEMMLQGCSLDMEIAEILNTNLAKKNFLHLIKVVWSWMHFSR